MSKASTQMSVFSPLSPTELLFQQPNDHQPTAGGENNHQPTAGGINNQPTAELKIDQPTKDERVTKKKPFCEVCKKPWHTKETCWEVHGKPADWRKKGDRKWTEKKGTNHSERRGQAFAVAQASNTSEGSSFSKEQLEQIQHIFKNLSKPSLTPNPSGILFPSTFLSVNHPNINTYWLIDSGASDHMTGNPSIFTTYFPCAGNQKIRVADGSFSAIAGKGVIKLTPSITLHDVLHVPNLTYNLLSISKITQSLNCKAIFYEHSCVFQDNVTGRMIGNARQDGGLFFLQDGAEMVVSRGLISRVDNSEVLLWHSRLGHPSFAYMKILFPKLFNNKTSFFPHCDVCELAKHKRSSFSPTPYKPSTPFSLIHTDVWGPSRINTLFGKRWFITFIEDHTRVCWVYLMKEKGDTKGIVENFLNMVQTQFGVGVQIIRSDNGKEYFNSMLDSICLSRGIVHQSSCVDTPQQNGVAERKNRHLLDITRSLLLGSGVPKFLWGEALLTATYLINRMPSKLLNFQPPLSIFKKCFPLSRIYSDIPLRTFGCSAFVHIHDLNRGKLDPRARKCIFVGYAPSQKGYKCYDPYSRKISVSMDVTFDESQFPYHTNLQGEKFTLSHDPTYQNASLLPKPTLPLDFECLSSLENTAETGENRLVSGLENSERGAGKTVGIEPNLGDLRAGEPIELEQSSGGKQGLDVAGSKAVETENSGELNEGEIIKRGGECEGYKTPRREVDNSGGKSIKTYTRKKKQACQSPLPNPGLEQHQEGVIAMAWCPSDSSYLLTCAKDNQTFCWDTVTGEIVCELPAGTNWNFDVHWYPKMPGVLSASSFDGKIGIYNIEGCSRYSVGERDFGAATLRAPKWYRRPVGASFGFGGKVVSFRPRVSGLGTSASSEVFVHNLVTEESLVSRSSEFESSIQNGERSSLRVLCEKKSQESESQDDRETWGFLKVMFEDDGTARTKLLKHLGFSLPAEEKDSVQDDLSQSVNEISLENKVAEKMGYEGEKEATLFAADNGEDFFNNLPSPKADTPVSTSENNFAVESTDPSADLIPEESEEPEESADALFDDAVQRALVVGDYKGAVEQCIAANKIADALVIAHVGGASLWESTRNQYLKMSRSPYLKVVSAMVNNDLMGLVNSRPLKFWKETLALLCTFAQGEEWSVLCDMLASKLMVAGKTLAATLCYICAGNIDKTVEIWSRCLTTEFDGRSYVDLLQDLMEKTIVLALATGQKQFSASLYKLVEKYAEILASQGLLTTAMEYLKLLGSDELSPELVILKDRIALSTGPEQETSSAGFGYSHPASGPVFDSSQNLYPVDTAAPQVYPSVPDSAYDGNYQRSFSSYGGGHAPPTSFQPQPPPANMFVPVPAPAPAPAPHVSPASCTPSPATTQPAVRPFVPSNPPVLRNADQYQQPTTLGSHLYAGGANPTYPLPPGTGSLVSVPSQVGSVPGPRMPQVVASSSAHRGYMPGTNTPVVQRPGMGPMQPHSPTQSAPIQPAAAPAVLPPTVQTVNTSNVPANQKPVITTLTRLFNETSQALGGARANAAKKREIEDNSKKIGALFAKLNSGDISKNASDKLIQLCQALDNNDFGTALQIQVLLTTSEWDECNFWLATLKRMIKTRQNVR